MCRQLQRAAVPLAHSDVDLTNHRRVAAALDALRPGVVINAAAFTDVDRAEADPDACRAVNTAAAGHLAEVCGRLGITLVQISTDYVFGADRDRSRPYREDDPTGPVNVYGRSKRDGEALAARHANHLIVRTCGLYAPQRDGEPAHRNFPNAILRLARRRRVLQVVDDQHCTPSYVPHVAAAILRLIEENCRGVYHVVNAGQTNWREFAAELLRQAGMKSAVHPISSATTGRPAQRPHYSVLSIEKCRARLGQACLPTWRQALGEFVACAPHSHREPRT